METSGSVESIEGDVESILTNAASDSTIATQSIEQIELTVHLVTDQSDLEQVILAMNVTSILLHRAKQIRQTLEQAAIQWIDLHGPIDIGDIRYTVGHPKKVTCVNVVECTKLVLERCAGDLDDFCQYFGSNPYKYGSVNRLIGEDQFTKLFKVEYRPKLIEGKPQKELIRLDQRYLRDR